jgi:hypothetical protein
VSDAPTPSQQLRSVLDAFPEFLDSDDVARADAVSSADTERLQDLVAAVEPLFDEINQLLDRIVALEHPVVAELEELEEVLNSLGQVGIEAEMELEDRKA